MWRSSRSTTMICHSRASRRRAIWFATRVPPVPAPRMRRVFMWLLPPKFQARRPAPFGQASGRAQAHLQAAPGQIGCLDLGNGDGLAFTDGDAALAAAALLAVANHDVIAILLVNFNRADADALAADLA